MTHIPRLTHALRSLLYTQRVAALGTLDDAGAPFVSMMPFAVDGATAQLIIHVSGLALHTGYLLKRPQVSLLVMQSETVGEPVHALPRVSLQATAQALAHNTPAYQQARSVYLARFPEAEPMTALGDFMFVTLALQGARQVAGFGAARSVDANTLAQALAAETPASSAT